ncbi:MAG TPA: hypothetical protein VKG45_08860 [Actinomycetes bacterium]|nr:hypothetical protein [Actinomycetes bacterium]
MGALLLILAVLCGVVLADAVVENADAATLNLFGQALTGFTAGALLIMAAALGAVITCLLLFSVAASGRRRVRRRELRSSHHELEDRIADLERENATLRTQRPRAADGPLPAAVPPAPTEGLPRRARGARSARPATAATEPASRGTASGEPERGEAPVAAGRVNTSADSPPPAATAPPGDAPPPAATGSRPRTPDSPDSPEGPDKGDRHGRHERADEEIDSSSTGR